VQSQANRMELALLDAWEDKLFSLPVITVDFAEHDLLEFGDNWRITSLEAPHRIADAILRDSLLTEHDEEAGTLFSRSRFAKKWGASRLHNATALFELCPTALIFGTWGSPTKPGGLGARFTRAIVSEIVALHATPGIKTASRLDPLGIRKQAGPVYKAKAPNGLLWTLDKEKAEKDKQKPVNLGKDGSPSRANHSNIPPDIIETGGITMTQAVQTTVLSLPVLRRLRFPLQEQKRSELSVDHAARVTLAALALCAATLTREQGCDLRSRCTLVPETTNNPFVWELPGVPGEPPRSFSLLPSQAIELLQQATEKAQKAGLPWMKDELELRPSTELVALVKRSQELATQLSEENEGE
jgi:CRISPR-associated protein Csb1